MNSLNGFIARLASSYKYARQNTRQAYINSGDATNFELILPA